MEDKILKRNLKFKTTCKNFEAKETRMISKLSLRKEKLNDLWETKRFSKYNNHKENSNDNFENVEDLFLDFLLKKINGPEIIILDNEEHFAKLLLFLENSENKNKEGFIDFFIELLYKHPRFYKYLITEQYLYNFNLLFSSDLTLKIIQLIINIILENFDATELILCHDIFRKIFEYSKKEVNNQNRDIHLSILKLIIEIIKCDELKNIHLFACLEIILGYLKNEYLYISCFSALSLISEKKNGEVRKKITYNKNFQNLFRKGIKVFSSTTKVKILKIIQNVLKEDLLIEVLINLNVVSLVGDCLNEKDEDILNFSSYCISLISSRFSDTIYENQEIIPLLIKIIQEKDCLLPCKEQIFCLCYLSKDCRDVDVILSLFINNGILEIFAKALKYKNFNYDLNEFIIFSLENIFDVGIAHNIDISQLFDEKHGGKEILNEMLNDGNSPLYDCVNIILAKFYNKD